ncbi:hypothetical protein C5167_037829 [Papaver somniferum]|uniref:HAT C-terminal dimerisation domain-containing protein n=1 Tax=Papaver somniferum TaxID=3469 RepID=A0A4Y7IAY4_PAPSO|nr:hypothetical protein C5167_037829 [Papaver somniferum]
MGLKMREKFNAYWSESNLIMSIGVVLDPRYKAKWVRFTYKIIFGDNKRASVEYEKFRIDLTKIFKAYESQNNTSAPAFFSNSVSRMDVRVPGTTNPDYATFLLENDEYDVQKSELETYLEEPILPTVSPQDEYNFDILSWWKLSAAKYPILSKIARDVLAVPVTSVASESMFIDGGRIWKSSTEVDAMMQHITRHPRKIITSKLFDIIVKSMYKKTWFFVFCCCVL